MEISGDIPAIHMAKNMVLSYLHQSDPGDLPLALQFVWGPRHEGTQWTQTPKNGQFRPRWDRFMASKWIDKGDANQLHTLCWMIQVQYDFHNLLSCEIVK